MWAALVVEEDSHGRGVGILLVEAEGTRGRGQEGGGGGDRGGGGVEQQKQWEDPSATHPDRKDELSQTNCGVR